MTVSRTAASVASLRISAALEGDIDTVNHATAALEGDDDALLLCLDLIADLGVDVEVRCDDWLPRW